MKKYYPAFLIFALFSCELIVDIDVPFKKAQLTLNTYFNPDSVWETFITLNRSILTNDTIPYQVVENAQVTIYDGDNPIETLKHKGFGYYRSDSGKPLVGKVYEIRASAPGYDPVVAQSSIPSPVQITNVHVDESEVPNQDGTPVTLKFTDNAQERNFYWITVTAEDEYVDYQTHTIKKRQYEINIDSNDPAFDENSKVEYGLLIKDILFNGKEAELSLKMENADFYSTTVLFHLHSVSEEYYNYRITAELQDNTSGDPFAQPVNVSGNIQNGFGIFAGYSVSTYTRDNPTPAPVITGFSPKSGKPGDQVTIYGENLLGGDGNRYYGTARFWTGTSYVYAEAKNYTNNEIRVIVPAAAVTGKIYYQGRRVALSDEEFEVIK